MAVTEVSGPGADPQISARLGSETPTWARVLRYGATRLIAILIAIIVAIYATILIANMGGHVDEMRKAQIRENLALFVGMAEEFKHLSATQKREMLEEMAVIEERKLNLHQPFPVRSFRYLWNGLTLNLGRAEQLTSDSGSRLVRQILLERLGPTLLLTSSAFLVLFFVGLFFGLALSRGYGSLLDRLVVAMAPSSAAPSWFYGIFLILIFGALLGWLPFGGMVDSPPPPNKWDYFLSVLRHLILPAGSIVISSLFLGIYSNRTFFLIYSSEDYVDMAKAKGLSPRAIERRYILRPTLPTIVTQFALAVITLWSGSLLLEQVFQWPGLGRLVWEAIGRIDTPIIVASTIIYAYLLAITVFVLDIAYALLDPRVQVGSEAKS